MSRFTPSRLLQILTPRPDSAPHQIGPTLRAAAVVASVAIIVSAVVPTSAAFAADTSAPSTPGSVAASYYGGVGTAVTWGKVSASDLAEYRVYRSSVKAVTPTAANLVASTSALKFTDNSVTGGATVYYAVTAKDKSGNESKLSSVKMVTATDTKKPDSPSSVKATVSTGGIALDWADNDEIDLRGYVVSRSASSSGSYTQLTSSPITISQFTDSQAPAGVKSYYRITAVDLTGNSSSASSTSATRPAGAPSAPTSPAPPTGLSATVDSKSAVVLKWTASSGATSYVVSRATSESGTYVKLNTSTLTGVTFTDTTAPARATAYYSITAVNAAGSSTAATVSVAVPGDTTPPTAPSSPKVVILATGGVTVSWKASSESDVAGYIVYKRNSDEEYVQHLPTGAETAYPTTSFTDTSVTEGKTIYYRIRAIDRSGNVSKNYVAVTANNPNVAPVAPSSFTVKQNATAGLDLAWASAKDTDVAGYSIYRSTSSSGTYVLLTSVDAAAAGTPPHFTDSSAPKGVTVYYRVTASDLVGNVSKNSSTVSGTSLTNPVAIQVEVTILEVGVDKQFASIGAALDAIPSNSLKRYRIDIAPGTYRETLRIDQSNVTLHGTGSGPAKVVIDAAHASGTTDPDEPEETLGTAGSAVVFVTGTDVSLDNLTVSNSFDEKANPQITSAQAVALRVEGDRFVANTVRLLGNQDTLLADTPKPTTRIRQYYVDSYIEGDVDYLFGAGTAVFQRVTFRSLDRGKSVNGYLTAASTDSGSKYGFLITDSKIVSDAPDGTINLGRPWHPSADPQALGSVVIKNTWLPSAVDTAAPWDDMASTNSAGVKVNFSWTGARFSEFQNIGPGATVNVNRPQLTAKDAANATPEKYLAGKDGWNPVVTASSAAPEAPSGVVVAADSRVVHLTWEDDTSASVIGWSIYRSTSGGAYTKVASVDEPTYSDTTVANGVQYSYTITADARSGASSAPSTAVEVLVKAAPLVSDITVDPTATANGSTVFSTLAEALAAAPAGTATNPTVITLAAGRYTEYDTIAKPYTVLVGATGKAKDVVITGNRAAGTPTGTTTDGVTDTYGTSGSATLLITGNNVQLRDLTVENNYVEGTYTNGQAVALRTTGDKLVLENIRLLGNQDTFYANSPNTTTGARVYVHDSYIEGDVDFIFGRATVVVDDSTLFVLEHGTSPNGSVTAASTDKSQSYGILITNSRIIGNAPDGSQNLGRPWQPGQKQDDGTSIADANAIAQVVVRDSWLGSVVSTGSAWTDMVNSGVTTSWTSARFSEYSNSGPGAATGATRPQLTAAAAEQYTATNYLAGADGWNPLVDSGADAAPSAVTGLVATADEKQVGLTWNDGAESDVVTYRVYRSAGSDTVEVDTAHLVGEVYKPLFLDKGLTNGTEYHYLVVAVDRAGGASDASKTVSATPNAKPLVADLTVAADGSGDYTTLQAALTAVSAGTSAKPKVIVVKPGTYREVVASTKANVIIVGSTGNPRDVVITFDNANGTTKSAETCPTVAAATCGTAGSATVTLSGAGVQVRDLTIANTFVKANHPEIGSNNTQAVALRATGDRQVYNNVRLLGVQDTLNADASGNISANGAGYPRQYYVNSFIEGNVDFIFGRAAAVFDRVTIHATEHGGGTIFAPSTASRAHGYLVIDSRISSDNDAGTFALGRPWRSWTDGAFADNSRGETIIRNTWIAEGISTNQPWTDFSPNLWTDGRFFEYGNTGPGASVNANRPQLTATQAADYTAGAFLAGTDGWNPVVDLAADTAPAAPVGLTAAAGGAQVLLSWDESDESDVTGYNVYRDGTLIATTTKPSFTNTGLSNDVEYRFSVAALDAQGTESERSTTVSATPRLKVDARVDANGTYKTLQDAVNAAPATGEWVIEVAAGTYAGRTTISRSNVTIVGAGESRSDVVLTSDGTSTASTLAITGASVTVSGISIVNTSTVSNSPAVWMTGDKILLRDVVLSGTDRTVWADVPTAGATSRQMIENSSISGANNVVLGRATLVIHDTDFTAMRTSGTMLVPSTTANGGKGFLVIDSTVTPATGISDIRLGAPYAQGSTTAANAPQAIVRNTTIAAGIKSAPWQDFNGYRWTDARFAEYANTGAGAAVNDNRPQLSPAESVSATVSSWLGAGTWYPAVEDPATPVDTTAPGAPADLSATAADASATLTWTAPTEGDLAGYRVYRSTSSPVVPGSATLVAKLGEVSTYTATGLVNNTAYYYALKSIDQVGNLSEVSTVSVTPADSTPPAAPVGVTATGGDSRVVLSWTANTEGDLAGYNVYRGGSKLNSELLTSPTFSERELTNDTSYSYAIRAVDKTGLESESAVVEGTPKVGDAVAPAVPTDVKTVLGKGSVAVNWTAVGDTDLASYEIRRDGTAIGTVAPGATTYVDSTVVNGSTYAYSVTAIDAAGNASAASSSASATPIKVDVVVAADGSGDAATVADGIAKLADNADYTTQGYRTILVKPGTYTGVVASGNRYGVRLIGATADAKDVTITAPASVVATLTISGKEWAVKNVTIASTGAAVGAQATAVQVKSGDKQVFDNVRMLGDKQTLLVSTANATTFSRVYVTNSYIEGAADLILGRAITVIDHSTIHVLNRSGASLTDSSIAESSAYGFLITDSSIVTDGNPGSIYLGRPYSTTGKAQVVVRNTDLGSAINTTQPWKDWDANVLWTAGRFFEYQNTGAGAAVADPAKRPQLSDGDAANYTAQKYLAGTDGWNPTSR